MHTAWLMLPDPGDRTVERLRRKVELTAARALLEAPLGQVPRALRRGVDALQRHLRGALRDDARALLDALGTPDALPAALGLATGAASAERAWAVLGPSLLGRLGRTRRDTLLWDAPLQVLPLNGRTWRLAEPASGLLVDPLGLELRLADGSLHRVRPDAPPPGVEVLEHTRLLPTLELAAFDPNPLADQEAHPDKQGNALSWGGRTRSDWESALGQALDLIRLALPGWYQELPTTLRRLVPVGYHPEVHLSASYREAPGLAYLTLHPDPVTMAEAIVHETQHGKLNLLTWVDPVLENGHTEWTSSPVRPDLRPLMGVLLAAHAFVPVEALHAGLRAADHPAARTEPFARRVAEVRATNARSLAILAEKARPTAAGSRLLEELRRLHRACGEAA